MVGRVEIHAYESALLRGNPLQDPCTRQIPVYLPPGYDRADADYPVLFALAGFTGTGRSFLNHDWYQENLPQRLDRLITAEGMPPVIVLMVDGMTRVGGNQYIDSAAVGPWASHIVHELVPWVESAFRVRPGRAHRGVFGKSSGGYGAVMMALEHADTFAAAASHSGDAYFEYCYAPDFPKAADGLRSVGGLGAFLAGLHAHRKFPDKLFHTLNVVAMAHFYGPNAAAPHGFDLPFDERTGERDEAVFARWKTRDPVELVAARAADLKRLALLWIECGAQDEWNLHHGARILSARLTAHGVAHGYAEFEDNHRSLNYRYDETLPRLAAALL
ncbi:MAG: alpha/beta hydrolase-fold protein [Planctomycetota bacterium]|nr:alpha/beta hydrolase-fold protein [Planctomycetota bacterium]